MRADQARDDGKFALAYANRWRDVSPWVLLAMRNNGGFSSEKYDGYRNRHRDRLLLLHQAMGISMKVISRHMLDDPRLSEPEIQEKLMQYRKRQEVYDSMKRKRSNNANS